MGFTLPRLTTEIDCADLGYPGLAFTCWLNIIPDNWEAPKENRKAWETPYYHALGRILLRLVVPPEMGDQGIIELGTAEAIYQVEQSDGFDQQIFPWLFNQFRALRTTRLEAETKNS